MELKRTTKAMLARIRDVDGLLETQITSNGRREEDKLNALIMAGYVEKRQHPSIKDRFWDRNALALYITDTGRAALGDSNG